MRREMTPEVVAAVRSAVLAIPAGEVAAYGEIGLAVGIGPRQAGRAVSMLGDDVPWWRVVYAGATGARPVADRLPWIG